MKFKVNRAAVQQAKEEVAQKIEKAQKENCKKYSEKYQDVVPKVEMPILFAASRKVETKLVFSVSRTDDDDINEVMLDIRTFIKRDDEGFIPTKAGIHIPMKYAEQLAGTIQELIDDVKAAKVDF